MRPVVLAFVLAACSASTPVRPPSVLLITLDTTRADHLGPYGYADADTPTWDRLAREGTTFDRCYAVCPLTIPSHSSILTGLTPPQHGVRDNGAFVLGDDAITLAERFHDAGYATAAFTAAFPTQRRWGFAQGFDVYHDPLDRLPDELDWRDERTAEEVIDDALATLPGAGNQPVFTWVHLFDAHWPYQPPESYQIEHPNPYDGEIAFADHQVSRLLDWWDAHHPDSLVVVTADHGEGQGDGGELTHGFLLHDGTMRVPLILRGHGVPVGERRDEVVSSIDIAPTVLLAAGLRLHEGIEGHDLLDGGSGQAWSEAQTARFNLGLSPLVALTEERGRYTEGGWGAWYPAIGNVVALSTDSTEDLAPHRDRLHALEARFGDAMAPTAALDAEALEQLAALGYMGGAPTTATSDIDPRDVIDIIPLTWEARQAIGAGRLPAAHKMIDRLAARMPGTFGVATLQALLARNEGRVDDAVQTWIGLYLDAPSATVALQIADSSAQLGAWPEALEWYQEALDQDAHSADAMGGVVRGLVAVGQLDEARDRVEDYLRVFPDHARLRLARAQTWLIDGRPDLAARDTRIALAKMKPTPEALALDAQARWETGYPDPAIERLEQALRLEPRDLDIRVRLAECLLEVGRNAEAARTIAPAARLLPDEPALVGLHARALTALDEEKRDRR